MFDVTFFLVTDADASIDAEKSHPVTTSFCPFRIVQSVPPSSSSASSDHPRQTQYRRDGTSERTHAWISGHIHFFRSWTLFLARFGSLVSTTFGLHFTSVTFLY
jgi:hypothetical protein